MNDPVELADRRELFVDDALIDRLINARLALHEPAPGGTAIRIDRPWEGPGNFGLSVLKHQERYHLYYRGWADLQGDQNGLGCVAISDDGETWTKPALGLFHRPGWEGNNIIVSDTGRAELSFPFAPWVDTRPGVPEEERIKGVICEPLSGEAHTAMRDPGGPKRMVLWTSADGFRFRRDPGRSTFISRLDNAFDGGNTLFWSEAEQQYVLYYRCCDTVEGVRRRTMARATSKDLADWSDSVVMDYGDSPREQFYVNNTQPYFRAPHLYIAPAARFMEGRRVITDAQAEAIQLQTIRGGFYGKDCSDAVLLTSRAGSTRYDRTFMETFVRPGPGAQNWVTRTNYPLTGLLPCGPDKIMLFVSRHYVQKTWHVERLLLRTDGFASVRAPWEGGELLTRPLIFSGNELEINYRTGAPGFVRVEIQDAAGDPIPGYTLDACPEIIGDEIERVVAWKPSADVGHLAGRPVRLRFVMKDADLYSFRFQKQIAGGCE
jgi:hypothetical protein